MARQKRREAEVLYIRLQKLTLTLTLTLALTLTRYSTSGCRRGAPCQNRAPSLSTCRYVS